MMLYFYKIMCIKFTYFIYAERSLNFQDPFCQMLKEHHARMRLAHVEILPLSRATTLVHRVKRMHE